MNFDLFKRFAEQQIGHTIESSPPRRLGGWEVVEALWPLNEVFRPNFSAIKSLSYDPAFEGEADMAIGTFVFNPAPDAWAGISTGAWRVLLERHMQAIIVAIANDLHNNPMLPIPADLPRQAWTGAVLLFLYYGMNLPYPPEDRSARELYPASALATLRRH